MNRVFCSFILLLSILSVAQINAKETLRSRSESSHHKRIIRQKDLPVTITRSGEYEIACNLTFNGSGAAITVSASNVEIDFEFFGITVTDPSAIAVLVNNPNGTVADVVIKDGCISYPALGNKTKIKLSSPQNGSGIAILNAQKVIVQNFFIQNATDAVNVQGSTDVKVLGSNFANSSDAGLRVSGSRSVDAEGSTFVDNNFGILYDNDAGKNQDGKVLDCTFPNSIAQDLLANQIDGLIIDRCAFTNSGPDNTANIVQLGDGADPSHVVTNASVKNSTFTNVGPASTLEGLHIQQGQDFLVDSCLFLNNNTADRNPSGVICADFSGIHVAGASTDTNNAIVAGYVIRNCVVQGPANDGIYPDINATNGLIEYNLTTGVEKDGILIDGTTFTTIQYNTSSNNGRNGIGLAQTSTQNSVLYNVTSGNGADGIFISRGGQNPATCGGTFADSTLNTVQYNTSHNNAGFGINDQPSFDAGFAKNQILYNTAFNNSTDYNGVNPATIKAPGVATVTGQNITGL